MKNLIATIGLTLGMFLIGCASGPLVTKPIVSGAETRQPSSSSEVPSLDCTLPDSVVSFKTYPPEWYAMADITGNSGAKFRNQILMPVDRRAGGLHLRNIRQLRTATYQHTNTGVNCFVTILSDEIASGGSVPAKFVCDNQQYNVTCKHYPSVYEN